MASLAKQPPHRPFSSYLRARLSSAHEHATQNVFFKALFSNKLSKEEYIRFLESAYYIYDALERELAAHAGEPGVKPIHFPAELNRVQAIEADLMYYTGHSKPRSEPMDVVARYVARIEEVARAEKGLGATLLLAHSYTRYFGDLSGGQFISLQLQKNWNLPGFEGREFYHFADISDIREFKNLYLANADKMAETILDSKKKEDQIVDEALKVYRMNDAMLSACMGKEAHVAGDEDKSYRAFRAAGRVEYGHGIRSKQFNEAVWIEVGRMEQVDHRTETARRLIALMIAGSVGLLLVVLRDWSWAGFSWF